MLQTAAQLRALLGRLVGATAQNITSSTDATPAVVTIAAHGLETGDVIAVANHATNTTLNGARKVVKINANTFSMTDMAGTAIDGAGGGDGGATGTIQRITNGLRPGDLLDLQEHLDQTTCAAGDLADNNRAAESTVKTILGIA